MTLYEKALKFGMSRPGKWTSIGLTNACAGLTMEELNRLLPYVQHAVVVDLESRIKRLTELDAPDVILESVNTLLAKAKDGKNPMVQTIRWAIVKRTSDMISR
jgi:hypothetical protein